MRACELGAEPFTLARRAGELVERGRQALREHVRGHVGRSRALAPPLLRLALARVQHADERLVGELGARECAAHARLDVVGVRVRLAQLRALRLVLRDELAAAHVERVGARARRPRVVFGALSAPFERVAALDLERHLEAQVGVEGVHPPAQRVQLGRLVEHAVERGVALLTRVARIACVRGRALALRPLARRTRLELAQPRRRVARRPFRLLRARAQLGDATLELLRVTRGARGRGALFPEQPLELRLPFVHLGKLNAEPNARLLAERELQAHVTRRLGAQGAFEHELLRAEARHGVMKRSGTHASWLLSSTAFRFLRNCTPRLRLDARTARPMWQALFAALLAAAVGSTAASQSYLFQPGYLADGNDLGELFFDISVRQPAALRVPRRRAQRSTAVCPPIPAAGAPRARAQDAKKYCDAEKTCQGFTFKELDEPTQKLSVRFKSNAAVTYDPSWLSYTKSSTPTPYFYQAGFLGDGKELHSAQMTLADAQVRPRRARPRGRALRARGCNGALQCAPDARARRLRAQMWCDKSSKCKGFSADKPKMPTDTVFCRFSDSATVTYDGSWMTYTKVPKTGAHSPYTFHPGYLGDGKPVHEAFMTIDNAKMYCDANAKCAGFTADKQPAEPSMEMFVRFKSSPVVSYDANFASYVKDAIKSEL